jgi:hypothetical protein
MIRRLISLLRRPSAEWPRIRDDAAGVPATVVRWVLPLALLPFAAVIAVFLFFCLVLGADAGLGLLPLALGKSAIAYAVVVAWVFCVAWWTDWLAPKFGGARDFSRAFKLVAHALAPAALFSLLFPLPVVQPAGFAGLLWSAWLLRSGIPLLMDAPERKSTAYAAAVCAGALLSALLFLWLPSCNPGAKEGSGWLLVKLPKPVKFDPESTPGAGSLQQSPEVKFEGTPASGTGVLDLSGLSGKSVSELIEEHVDPEKLRELERLAREIPRNIEKLPSNPPKATKLADFLPESACGLPRANIEGGRSTIPGASQVAQAIGIYQKSGDPRSVRIEIGDNSPSVFGLVSQRTMFRNPKMPEAMRSKMYPPEGKTTNGLWIRLFEEDGRFIEQRHHEKRGEAMFTVLLAERFVVRVAAEGGADPVAVEAAARAIDWRAIEAFHTTDEP